MTLAMFRRYHNVLQPTGDEAREMLEAIKNGAEVMVEVRTARNIRQHKLFFALLAKVVENSDFFVSVDHALIEMKLACHEYDLHVTMSGERKYIPRSLKFHSMPQDRFNRLFKRAIHIITTKWIPGLNKDDLLQEVYRMIDGPQALGERAA